MQPPMCATCEMFPTLMLLKLLVKTLFDFYFLIKYETIDKGGVVAGDEFLRIKSCFDFLKLY